MVEANPPEAQPAAEDPNNPDAGAGDQVIDDPNVFEKQSDVFAEEQYFDFSVRDPQDFGGHIVYNVKGRDHQGLWECKRRYNEFFLLQEALAKRWPGILLPIVPPKKAMGNKDLVFLQERRFYLERYLRKLARHEFIINSQEFQLFARPQGLDVEKSLNKLPKLSNGQLYDRLKDSTCIQDEQMTDQLRDSLDVQLQEFTVFIKKIEPFLKNLKNDLTKYLSTKQMVLQCYAGTANILTEYEDHNLKHYVNDDTEKLVVGNPSQSNLVESLRHTVDNLRNPFTDLFHWVKGELYDIAAFSAALNERKNVIKKVDELKKKIVSTQQDITNVNSGKKTMGTLFKNSSDVGSMTNKLDGYEKDLEMSKKLIDLISMYLGQRALPEFKQEKMKLYCRILQQFHVIEISNSYQLASFWSQILNVPQVRNANVVAAAGQ